MLKKNNYSQLTGYLVLNNLSRFKKYINVP